MPPKTDLNVEWIGDPEGIWDVDIHGELVVGANPLAIADRNVNHLWPEYRERQSLVFHECRQHGLNLVMFEGVRSTERQLWLYGQGRPRSKPYGRKGTIVTGLRTPLRHGPGCASDNYPDNGHGQPIFAFSTSQVNLFRSTMKKYGCEPTKFAGDYGHMQGIFSSKELAEAQAWQDAGRPVIAPKRIPLSIVVNGVKVKEAQGYLESGRSYAAFRPIAEALRLDFKIPITGRIQVWFPDVPDVQISLPVWVEKGVSWIALRNFTEVPGIRVTPDIGHKIVRITSGR